MTRENDESRSTADDGALRKSLVELKAGVDSPRDVERRLRASGARFQTTLHQRDVYFRRVRGRLKLRIQRPGRDQLVWYDRPDVADTKESHIVLTALPRDHGLEPVLSSALGVRVVVTKVRHVFEWRDTRVHVDDVAGLGAYLEFERTLEPDALPSVAHSELRAMLAQLGIPAKALERGSYSDLLLRRASRPGRSAGHRSSGPP